MKFYTKYDCIYSAEGTVTTKQGTIHKVDIPLDHYACFSDIYRELRTRKSADIEYKIYLFKEDLKDKDFNLCSKLETKKILRCLRKTVDFTYKFTSGKYTEKKFSKKKVDFRILTIRINGTFAQHLWVTSMLRCFFEYPYNIAAKDACEMQATYKGDIDLSKANWINLYLTIASKIGSTGLHGVVDRYEQPLAYTYKEWKDKISKLNSNVDVIRQLKSNHCYKTIDVLDIEEEEYSKGVQNRASLYVSAYKDKLSWRKK